MRFIKIKDRDVFIPEQEIVRLTISDPFERGAPGKRVHVYTKTIGSLSEEYDTLEEAEKRINFLLQYLR